MSKILPGWSTVVRAPTSPVSRSSRTPSSPISINRPVTPATRHTTPADVADVRVNPPRPSIVRIIFRSKGDLTNTYLIPKSANTLLLDIPEPSMSACAATAI